MIDMVSRLVEARAAGVQFRYSRNVKAPYHRFDLSEGSVLEDRYMPSSKLLWPHIIFQLTRVCPSPPLFSQVPQKELLLPFSASLLRCSKPLHTSSYLYKLYRVTDP